ncbi:MAG: hypothetical protein QOD63_2728, partial [Actinomycetota bacterium]|nr:hypothetical protein [Actinomycetota bacterium]
MTRRTVLVLAIASFAFAVLALMQAWTDAPTYDEPTYVTAGLTSLTRHDLRINPQHPPLAKLVAAVPVLALRPTIPRGPGWRTANERVLSAAFVRAQLDDGRLRAVFFAARLLPVLEAIAAGWVIALLAGELFGPGTAWLPGLLWLANPFVVGLGHVDGIDVPFALTALVAALAVLHARRRPSVRMATLVGVCGGLSVVTRATGLLVVAAAVVAVVAARGAGRPRRAAVVLGTAWLTIAIVYAAIAPAAVVSHR